MTTGWLVVDEPADGPGNMAVDQAFLQHVRDGGEAILRFYRWSPATLSLGYFQKLDDRALHSQSQSLPVVRRSTGGGAIVHDNELTYSLTLAIADRTSPAALIVYRQVHSAIRQALTDFGVVATPYRELPPQTTSSAEEPFLCFQRRTDEDLIVNGYKVVGSAQRRLDKALLQHGSILLRSSPFAPQLPGICELTGCDIRPTELIARISTYVAREVELDLHTKEGRVASKSVIDTIVAERFQAERWTARR